MALNTRNREKDVTTMVRYSIGAFHVMCFVNAADWKVPELMRRRWDMITNV